MSDSRKTSNWVRRGRKTVSVTCRIVTAVLVVAIVLIILAKYVAIPFAVRRDITDQIESVLDGTVTVERVRFRFFSPTIVEGVSFRDDRGRRWIHIERAEMTFVDFLAGDTSVAAIVADGVTVTAYFDDGTCDPPLQPATSLDSDAAAVAWWPDISIRRGRLIIQDDSGKARAWESIDLRLSPMADGGALDLRVTQYTANEDEWFALQGTVDPHTLQSRLMLATSQRLSADGAAVLLAAADVPVVTSATARVRANAQLTGRLDAPDTLEITGGVAVSDLVCMSGDQQINSDADVLVRFSGRSAQVVSANVVTSAFTISVGSIPIESQEQTHRIVARIKEGWVRFPNDRAYSPFWDDAFAGVRLAGWVRFNGMVAIPTRGGDAPLELIEGHAQFERVELPTSEPLVLTNVRIERILLRDGVLTLTAMSCDTCDGQVKGNAKIVLAPLAYETSLEVESLQAGQLLRAINPDTKITKGRIRGRIVVGGTGRELDDLHVNALLLGEDLDLEVNPVFFSVLKLVRVKAKEVKSSTDLGVRFHMDYPIVTIDKARLANRVSAMDVEPGGTIDVQSGQVDLYVVGGSYNDIRGNALRPFQNLGNRLTRLRIQGHWSDPPAKLVRKQTLTDIAGGAAGFFIDAVKVGGDVGARLGRFFGPAPTTAEPEPH